MSAIAPEGSVSKSEHWVLAWLRRAPWDALPITGLILTCLVYLFVVGGTAGVSGASAYFTNISSYAWVLAWMLAVSITVRTIGVRETVVAFFGGFFTSILVAELLTVPLVAAFGTDVFVRVYAVPTVEELAKIVPLLLLLLAYRRRRGERTGITDLVIAGFAVGAGYGTHEDLAYGRSVTSGDGTFFGTFDGAFGGLFPNFFVGSGTTLVAHAGWGLIVGLGVGVSALLWSRIRFFALIPGAVGVLLAISDHAIWNDRNPLPFALTLILQHQLAVYIVVLSIPAAMLTDYLLRRPHRGRAPLPFPSLRIYRYLVRRGGGWAEVLLSVLAYGHYRRGWYAEAYGAARGIEPVGESPRLNAWLTVAFPPVEPATLLPRTPKGGGASTSTG